MGFDLSGKNPIIHTPEEDFKILIKYDHDKWDSWAERQKEMQDSGEQDIYWEEYNNFQNSNPGTYFRNNVWWWRPLWDYVCANCDHFLTEDDMDAGSWNNGSFITKAKSKRIARTLRKLIDEGHTQMYQDSYMDWANKAKDSDKEESKWLSNYPFSVENVSSFATFSDESGGFYIC